MHLRIDEASCARKALDPPRGGRGRDHDRRLRAVAVRVLVQQRDRLAIERIERLQIVEAKRERLPLAPFAVLATGASEEAEQERMRAGGRRDHVRDLVGYEA